MDKTLIELPRLKHLDLLGTYEETFSSHQHVPKSIQQQLKQDGIPPCYYARTIYIYGTQTPRSETLDLYSESLYLQGWHSVTSLSGSFYFLRGDNEELHFDRALEWAFFYDDIGFDYEEMSAKYDELISVRVDYVWPKQGDC